MPIIICTCPIVSPVSSLDLNAVEVVAGLSDWKELGRLLGVSPVKITQLMEDGGDAEHCLEVVVQEWLNKDKSASWKELRRVLKQMGMETEVQIITANYLHDSDHLVPHSSEGTYAYVWAS